MSPMAASALRRAALATGALAVTLAGHALTSGGARVLPVAPVLWLCAVAVAVLPAAGHRGGYAFRALGPARLLAAQIGAQAATHLTLHAAPWALGIGVHHAGAPLVTPGAAALHLTLAVALTAALVHGERVLLRALALARALLGVAEPRRTAGRPPDALAPDLPPAPSQWRHRPRLARGPPAGGLPPAPAPRAVAASLP